MKKHIALVVGGYSSEREISLKSGNEMFSHFNRDLFEVSMVDIAVKKWSVLKSDIEGANNNPIDKNDFAFMLKGVKKTFDYVYIIIHGLPGENGTLQSYFDLLSIPYSSCDAVVSAITFDKALCKKVLRANPLISMPKDYCYSINSNTPFEISNLKDFKYPLFVKPTRSGSSFGISKVNSPNEVNTALEIAKKESGDILFEEMVKGVEVSCGICITKKQTYILPITQIDTDNDFFDYNAKYEGKSTETTPAPISSKIQEALNSQTELIYRELGCSGIVRIDFIIEDNIPYFIELNSIPGMSANSIIPQQLKSGNIELKELLTEIIGDKIKILSTE